MALAPDDYVIVHGDAELVSGINDLPRHVDISERWRGIAGGMVMRQNDGGSGKLKGAFHHFAGVDRRVIDSSFLLYFVGDELVFFYPRTECETVPCSRKPWRRGNIRGWRSMTRAAGG